MPKTAISVIYVFAMIATVIVIDISFFKNHTGARLAANMGIVLLYLAFYFRFFKRG